MQVDGEPCKVNPSIFTISLLNKATMLAHRKMGMRKIESPEVKNFEIQVYHVSMPNFKKYCSDMSIFAKSGKCRRNWKIGQNILIWIFPNSVYCIFPAIKLQKFEIEYSTHLGVFRDTINAFLSNSKDEFLSNDWYFLDCKRLKILKR